MKNSRDTNKTITKGQAKMSMTSQLDENDLRAKRLIAGINRARAEQDPGGGNLAIVAFDFEDRVPILERSRDYEPCPVSPFGRWSDRDLATQICKPYVDELGWYLLDYPDLLAKREINGFQDGSEKNE